MSFEVDGKLFKKFDTQQVTDRFQKRELVLEIDNSGYPQFVKFQLVQDRCSVLDPMNEGDMVKVHFDLRGREYTNNQGETVYFTNLQAWKIDSLSSGQNTAAASDDSFPDVSSEPATENENFDDLPF